MEIRIARPPESVLGKFAEHEQDFYFRHANIVKTILDMDEVQKTVSVMAKKESLDLKQIRDIRVMVFPHGSTGSELEHIKHLGIDSKKSGCVGTYNAITGTISIYPVITHPEKNTSKFLNNETLLAFIMLESVTALLEEILHVKYNEEYMKRKHLTREKSEIEARKIADKYTTIFTNDLESSKKRPKKWLGQIT